MAKCSVSWIKKGQPKATPKKAAAGQKVGDPLVFSIEEGNGDEVTVGAVDANGLAVDMTVNATITEVSDNTTVLTVGPSAVPGAKGNVFHETALAAGVANVTVTATATDGSWGPITITYPDTVTPKPPPTPGAPVSLTITHGPATINP